MLEDNNRCPSGVFLVDFLKNIQISLVSLKSFLKFAGWEEKGSYYRTVSIFPKSLAAPLCAYPLAMDSNNSLKQEHFMKIRCFILTKNAP